MAIKYDYEIDLTKQKSTYEVKAGVSYIEIPYTNDPDKIRVTTREDDPFKTEIKEVEYEGNWYEIIGGKRDKKKHRLRLRTHHSLRNRRKKSWKSLRNLSTMNLK